MTIFAMVLKSKALMIHSMLKFKEDKKGNYVASNTDFSYYIFKEENICVASIRCTTRMGIRKAIECKTLDEAVSKCNKHSLIYKDTRDFILAPIYKTTMVEMIG